MRTKSESRRQAILDVAAEVFREQGFEHTSMAEISARVGGSKATLYSYFNSKEEIFIETVRQSAERDIQTVFDALNQPQDDIRAALLSFGKHFMQLMVSPRLLAVRRLVYASAGQTDIGREFYERGPKLGDDAIMDYLTRAMQRGFLRDADPGIATQHLRGLLESSMLEKSLLRVLEGLSDEELETNVEHAVTVFLAAYGAGS